MTDITYQGLAIGEVSVGGPAGPERISAPAGGALAIYRIEGFQESDHARLAQLAQAPQAPQALGNDLAGKAAQLIRELESALANDGQIDAAEQSRLLQAAISAIDGGRLANAISAGRDLASVAAAIWQRVRGQ